MPISAVGSYPPTMQEFLSHWQSLNAFLGATPLLLRGGYAIANLTADRTAIVTAINDVIARDNAAQTARGNLEALKFAMRPRIPQFRKLVTAYIGGTGYAASLPVAPPFHSAESKFLDPHEDMRQLWATLNADTTVPGFTPPLLLANGYTLAAFTTELTTLRAAYVTARNTTEAAQLSRKNRDALLKPAYNRLKQYREVVQGRFDGTPFAATLPALTPPDGATPAPVVATGVWNGTAAALSWTPSPNPNLERYEIRCCTGTSYRTANEFSVGFVPAGVTTFLTTVGLAIPGAKCVYRVYVVLTSGNERGSNNVPLSRPA